jgi:hypothetical protein
MAWPNKATQFQKGKSGNPGGKAKGTVSLTATLRRMLEEPLEYQPDKADMTRAEAVCYAMIREAIKGKHLAQREIFDRIEGKPLQRHEVDGEEAPVLHIVLGGEGGQQISFNRTAVPAKLDAPPALTIEAQGADDDIHAAG